MSAPRHDDASSALRAFGLVFLMVLSGACGTLAGNPEDEDDEEGGPGPAPIVIVAPVRFSLTDAPVDDARSVLITVESLAVSLTGETWVTIPLTAATEIDLLQYQEGSALALGQIAELPVGTYNQTRLKLAETKTPKLVLADGTEHDLKIPSAEQTGIKIVTPFTVEAGKELGMTIDFDLRKSVKRTGPANLAPPEGNGNDNGNEKNAASAQGKYMMKPVLRLVRDDAAGQVTGTSAAGKTVCLYPKDTPPDATDDCDQAVNSGKVKNGAFKLAFVPAGEYALRIFGEGETPVDVAAVVVKAGEATDLGAQP